MFILSLQATDVFLGENEIQKASDYVMLQYSVQKENKPITVPKISY